MKFLTFLVYWRAIPAREFQRTFKIFKTHHNIILDSVYYPAECKSDLNKDITMFSRESVSSQLYRISTLIGGEGSSVG